MKRERKYFWQGEPVRAEFSAAFVDINEEKPLYWYNYECLVDSKIKKALIPAVKITLKSGEQFCIANHFGIGASKLKKGGWPDHRHFSIPVECFVSNMWDTISSPTEFDEESFSEYESKRNNFFKNKYPIEYQKMLELRKYVIRK